VSIYLKADVFLITFPMTFYPDILPLLIWEVGKNCFIWKDLHFFLPLYLPLYLALYLPLLVS